MKDESVHFLGNMYTMKLIWRFLEDISWHNIYVIYIRLSVKLLLILCYEESIERL